MTQEQFCSLHEEIENKLASGEMTMEQYLQHAKELRDRLMGLNAEISGYGYCPHCGARVTERERRINGNDICANGHVFPSSATLN